MSTPDPKNLPTEKKSALADKVADSVHKEITRHANDLSTHEVSKKDAGEIIGAGIKRGVQRYNDDLVREQGK